jgi:hypothetical protein
MMRSVKLVLSILAALAVLLMPAGMGERGAAMAATHDMTVGADLGHCAQKPEPAKDQPPESCCLVACSALPAEPVGMNEISSPVLGHAAVTAANLHGLAAEAATPPPRAS